MSHPLRRPAWAMLVALLAAPMGSCLQDDDLDDDDAAAVAVSAAAAAPVGSPNTGMTGDYFAVAFDSNPPSPATDSPTSFTGVWTFDGVGGFTATWTASEDGSIWVETGVGTYDLTAGGALSAFAGNLFLGGADSKRRAAVLGGNGFIAALVKRSGSYGQESLSGEYHVAGFQWMGPVDGYASYRGLGTFDSATGLFSFTATNNLAGTVSDFSLVLDYAVSPEGRVVLTDPARPAFRSAGGVMTGGDIMVAATAASGMEPMLITAIRKSGRFTAAALRGLHNTVSMGPSAAGVSSWSGETVFDGGSTYLSTGTLYDSSGTPWPNTTVSGTYAVSSDGLMTMEEAAGHYSLGVRKGGRAAAGASVTAAEPPRFVLGIRR